MEEILKFFNNQEYNDICEFFVTREDCEMFDADCKYANALADLVTIAQKNPELNDALEFLTQSVEDIVNANNKLAFFYGFNKCMQVQSDQIECESQEKEPVKLLSVSDDGTVLFGCKNKEKQVIVPDGVRIIAENTFEKCTFIEEITLPQGVRLIDAGAFLECENLREIIIPSSVKKIGKLAFSGCKNLRNVTFEGESTQIFDDSFENCAEITIKSHQSCKNYQNFAKNKNFKFEILK